MQYILHLEKKRARMKAKSGFFSEKWRNLVDFDGSFLLRGF